MKVLYITYIDFDGLYSGARLRPQKILDAFREKNHEVYVINGQQNKYLQRNKTIYSFIKKLDKLEFDLCYIESPPGPIFNYIDFYLIKRIHKCNIPILFYCRDLFWLFFEDEKKPKRFKQMIINLLNGYQVYIYRKYINKVYFSTKMAMDKFNEVYKLANTDILPPGCFDCRIIKSNIHHKTGIYVGTASSFYGVDILIEAYKLLNNGEDIFNLILVCPESDYKNFFKKELNFSWIEVYHTSGDGLEELYKRSDFGIIPLRESLYANMSYPIKLFDYLSYELPIISTKLNMVEEFINHYNIGYICEDNPESMASAIKKFYNSTDYGVISKNVISAKKSNLWIKRIEKVICDAKEYKKI